MRHFVTDGIALSLKGMTHSSYAAVVGLATALENAFPMAYTCAKEDIVSYAWTNNDGARIYLYDNSSGGLALTWAALDSFEELLVLAYETVANCEYCLEHPEENGCIHCVVANRWYTNSVKSDRLAVLELVKEMRTVLDSEQPKVSANALPTKTQREGVEGHFGRTMISNGSLVFTGKHQEGFVVASQPFNGAEEERLYEIIVNGKTERYLGRYLTLLQGDVEKWCLSCGQDGIERTVERCPTCEALL
ncbi:hypothetical protein CEB3_c36030 [Peptococcaceae bacterium CEB3]|nr:hypothetical protein CEB3_c36030 [Peptococcaceae bacterium CEB3]